MTPSSYGVQREPGHEITTRSTSKDAFRRGRGLDEAVYVRCALKARPKAWLSKPSNQCLQRLATTSTDCVEKRDPRQNATNQYYKQRELDFNARLEKRAFLNIIPT